MDISVTRNGITTEAARAYRNFKNCQIPFAAVKIDIRLQNTSKKEINDIVEENFRSENDLIFKGDKNYLVIMKKTSIEVAEKAVNRLKAKIGCLIARNCAALKDNRHLHASAFIFGCSRETPKMHIKYLDLTPGINTDSFDRKAPKIQVSYGEYLKCSKLKKAENLKASQMINLVI